MFKWLFGESTPPKFIEDHEEVSEVKPEPESIEDKYRTSLTYFTVHEGDGVIFMNAIMEPTEESVADMARIIANMFNIKIQGQTIQVIRENLLKSEQPDLLKHFERELIAAAIKKPVSNTETGEETPCVSPSDLMT